MSIKIRNLLFISYHFPPAGGAAVQRPLKFVKYLPLFGWNPIVLTVSNPSLECNDETLLQNLPQGVCIYKTYRLPLLPFAEAYREREKHNYDSSGKLVFMQSKNQFYKPFILIINKLFNVVKYIANNFVYIPDWHIGWLPGTVLKGTLLVRKNNAKVIYSTGEPWTSFLAAFLIFKLTKIPYILDFRDPWTLEPNMKSPGAVHKWFCERLEKLCIHRAHRVIFTCNKAAKSYQLKYESEGLEKFVVIPNGYEPEDFEGISRTKSDIFSISYIGSLYFQYCEAIDTLFRAINRILKKIPEMSNKLQINFVGLTNGYVEEYLQKYKIHNVVRIIGYVDYRDSIQYMVDAAVLLLFGDRSGLQVSGKAYQYLAAKRPILLLASIESDFASLVQDNKAGIVVDPGNVNGIERALLSFHNKSLEEYHSSNIKKYTRKELTKRLAREFDGATG